MKNCAVYKGGIVSYGQGVAIQEGARTLVAAGAWDGILILLEHTPVVTIGRSGGRENLLANPRTLTGQGVEVVDTNRGGNITCHNPGQIVGYPVLNLSRWQQDVHWYVRTIEETLIRTLARFGLNGSRNDHYPGVWLEREKVAAIGVYVKGWVTSHGFALNVNNDLGLFNAIVPCGIKDFGVTNLTQANCRTSVESVMQMFREDFGQVFDCTMADIDIFGDGVEFGGECHSGRRETVSQLAVRPSTGSG
ncbi:MAG: lipoyl(octanoyl) transferase LipB, partial [Deltaproteobacteria bacterium]|nr:lipoyl(octanoyl) transferase LipB [Deltaproteobacteria bacterium]